MTTTMTASPPPTLEAERSRPNWLPLLVVCAASFVVVLDFFIVNVALPALQTDLSAGSGTVEWVVAGYGLGLATGLIAGGRLGDRHGRRSMFCLGLALFTFASVLCGIAPTGGTLVAARVAQGLAAALLTPQVLAIIGVTYAGGDRLRALGIYGSTMGLAAVGGQLIGGALVSADPAGLGWRACFLINVPIGVATLLAARRWVQESRVDGAASPDVVGTALLAVVSLSVLLPLVEGRQLGWPVWTRACGAAAPALLLLFTAQQRRLRRRGGDPLVDVGLLRIPGFTAGLVAQLTLWCGQAAFFLVLALYLQQGRGLGALEAGLVFTLCAVSYVAAAGAAAGLVERFGRLVVVAGGLALLAGHTALALAVHEIGSGGRVMALAPGLLLVGLGMGLAIPALMATLLSGVDQRRAGSAAAVLSTVQNVGNALGVAITGVVFFGALDGGAAHAFGLGALQLAAVGLLVALLGFTLPGAPQRAGGSTVRLDPVEPVHDLRGHGPAASAEGVFPHTPTEEHDMPDLTTTIDTHLAAYGEPDATVRGPLVEQAWAPDGVLLDPPLTGEGHDGISAAADALQSQFAGHSFVRTSAVDEHHGAFRYAWELRSPDGTPVLAGTDVGQVADDGRLARVTGFFGELSPA